MTTATTIHICGTLRRYAPIATPTIRMMKPMRYVAKEDMIGEGCGQWAEGQRRWVKQVAQR